MEHTVTENQEDNVLASGLVQRIANDGLVSKTLSILKGLLTPSRSGTKDHDDNSSTSSGLDHWVCSSITTT